MRPVGGGLPPVIVPSTLFFILIMLHTYIYVYMYTYVRQRVGFVLPPAQESSSVSTHHECLDGFLKPTEEFA
jgi:hypothetical protein